MLRRFDRFVRPSAISDVNDVFAWLSKFGPTLILLNSFYFFSFSKEGLKVCEDWSFVGLIAKAIDLLEPL